MIKILIETIAEVVAKNQSQTEEILKWIKEQPEQSEPLQKISNRLEAIDVNVRNVPNKVSMPLAEIMALKWELRAHIEQLAIPLKNEVKHEHHIDRTITVCGVLLLIIMGLSFLLLYAWFEADQYKENDMKYRYLEVFQDSPGQKYLHHLDSQFRADPSKMGDEVRQQERMDRERFEEYQKLQETKNEEKELQDKLEKRHK